MAIDRENIERRFTVAVPDEDDLAHYGMFREACRSVAELFYTNLPDCRERSIAITKLEEAMMWANMGVARPNMGEDS